MSYFSDRTFPDHQAKELPEGFEDFKYDPNDKRKKIVQMFLFFFGPNRYGNFYHAMRNHSNPWVIERWNIENAWIRSQLDNFRYSTDLPTSKEVKDQSEVEEIVRGRIRKTVGRKNFPAAMQFLKTHGNNEFSEKYGVGVNTVTRWRKFLGFPTGRDIQKKRTYEKKLARVEKRRKIREAKMHKRWLERASETIAMRNRGMSLQEIAYAFDISYQAVAMYLNSLRKALGTDLIPYQRDRSPYKAVGTKVYANYSKEMQFWRQNKELLIEAVANLESSS